MVVRELAEQCGLIRGVQGEDEKLELFARLIRGDLIDAVHSEYDTWTGSYKPVVKVALQNLMQRMDPDATL